MEKENNVEQLIQDLYKDLNGKQRVENEKKNQDKNLEEWLNYFASERSAIYPDWFKYLSLKGASKIGNHNLKEKKDFIVLSPEALAITYHYIAEDIDGDIKLEKEQLEEIIEDGLFERMYTKIMSNNLKKTPSNTEKGKWITYKKGSNPTELLESLAHFYTGWSEYYEKQANQTLERFDVHVYYTKDIKKVHDRPRLLLTSNSKEVNSISGIMNYEGVEMEVVEPLKNKLIELKSLDKYSQAVEDLQKIKEITKKTEKNETLSEEDLKFLYQTERSISYFNSHSYSFLNKDPRIEKILETRNIEDDLCEIFKIDKSQISYNKEQALSGKSVVHFGNVYIEETKLENVVFPKMFLGELDISDVNIVNNVTLPEYFYGEICVERLKRVEGPFIFPKNYVGNLNFEELVYENGLKLPERIDGELAFLELIPKPGFKLPKEITGDIYLNSFTTLKDIELPEKLGGQFGLAGLETVEGLKFPEGFSGGVYFGELKNAKGLKLPEKIDGDLDFVKLETIEGLEFPKEVTGHLNLQSLKKADKLKIPCTIGESLYLNNLKEAEIIKIPNTVGGDIDLSSLVSTKKLRFPNRVGGTINITSLTKADQVRLPNQLDVNILVSEQSLAKMNAFSISKKINKTPLISEFDVEESSKTR